MNDSREYGAVGFVPEIICKSTLRTPGASVARTPQP